MTRLQFVQLLKKQNIDETLVSFGPVYQDGYCVRKNHLRWEVFVKERGREFDLVGFPSESSALQSLYENLVRIYGDR